MDEIAGAKQSDSTTGNPKHPGLVAPWPPGQSGNPAGRPRKGNAWADIRNELLAASKITLTLTIPDKDGNFKPVTFELGVNDEKSFRHAILIREISKALGGDIDAMKDLMDREEGKPSQSINLGGQEDNPLVYEEKKKAVVDRLLNSIPKDEPGDA
jgi:hypothetical protein